MNKILCPIQKTVQKYPYAIALVSGDKFFSYSSLDLWITKICIKLTAMGIKKNTRLAIVSRNCPEYIALLFALWRIGAVACPINPRFPRTTIHRLLKKIGVYRVWRESDFKKISHSQSGAVLSKTSFIALDQSATIIFTSGTTALPKAVLHSLGNHIYSALGTNKILPLIKGDRWLLSLPLYHVGGLGILFRVFLSGAAVIIPPQEEALDSAIKSCKPTHLSVVPTQLYRLLEKQSNKKNLKSFKCILLGGGPVPKSLLQTARHWDLPIHKTYGLTEMASQMVTDGKVLSCQRLKISNEGEILVRGKSLFQGYLEGKKIKRPLTKDGWFKTGDLGTMDKHGRLKVLGRRDNMFISGGENIYPEEIESILNRLSMITQSIVVPVPNKEFGFRPVAFIKVKSSNFRLSKNLEAHLKRYLPKFKIPDRFYRWPEEISPASLKIDRKKFINLIQCQGKMRVPL